MQLGPFDSRKKQSRCLACSASHLKCSGDVPCSNCTRRRLACSYKAKVQGTTPLILLDKGQKWTAEEWPSRGKHQPASPDKTLASAQQRRDARRLSPPDRLVDDSSRYLYYFDSFVQRNSFTGRAKSVGEDVKQLAGLHSRQGNHLMNAMLALGALHATRMESPGALPLRDTKLVAFQHYSYSIAGLREAIEQQSVGLVKGKPRQRQEQLMCILWTTLFLGLFELMNDATGHGWQQHIIHGTANALQASGPSACSSEPGIAFFTQAKLFEVCRTILFNEPTFLTRPEWVDLSRDVRAKQQPAASGVSLEVWRPLDSLLDIMVMCSSLRVRAAVFTERHELQPDYAPTREAVTIVSDGHVLREALNSWSEAYAPPQPPTQMTDTDASSSSSESESAKYRETRDPSMLLARVFFAAISIYLSGCFDYELSHWQRLGLVVPTLDEATVQHHVSAIMRLTDLGLKHTQLSPLVFLFPLRIAGARSYTQRQRDAVLGLVARIGVSFAVASAIRDDLGAFWRGISFSPA